MLKLHFLLWRLHSLWCEHFFCTQRPHVMYVQVVLFKLGIVSVFKTGSPNWKQNKLEIKRINDLLEKKVSLLQCICSDGSFSSCEHIMCFLMLPRWVVNQTASRDKHEGRDASSLHRWAGRVHMCHVTRQKNSDGEKLRKVRRLFRLFVGVPWPC